MTTHNSERQQCRFIVTHRRPDSDELFSIWLLKAFKGEAEKLFPGCTTAQIEVFTEDLLPQGSSAADFPHMLFIGCAKGELDEHPRKDQNQCAATRVAHKLGIRKDAALARLLRMTLEEDRGRCKVKNSFGDALKLVSQHNVEDVQKTFEWAQVAYNAIYAHDRVQAEKGKLDQNQQLSIFEVKRMVADNVGAAVADRWMQIHGEAASARDKKKNEARKIWEKAPIKHFVLPNSQAITLAVIRSNNDQVNYIGWREVKIGVLIQMTGEGNVQVYTRQDLGLCLREAARLIRQRELELKGAAIPHPNKLRATDTLEEVPEWHLMNTSSVNKPILFNGNQITACGVTPTQIPVEEIVELVIRGLELSAAPAPAPARKPDMNIMSEGLLSLDPILSLAVDGISPI